MGPVPDQPDGSQISEEEKTVRLFAVGILDDAQRRFVLFNNGGSFSPTDQ